MLHIVSFYRLKLITESILVGVNYVVSDLPLISGCLVSLGQAGTLDLSTCVFLVLDFRESASFNPEQPGHISTHCDSEDLQAIIRHVQVPMTQDNRIGGEN